MTQIVVRVVQQRARERPRVIEPMLEVETRRTLMSGQSGSTGGGFAATFKDKRVIYRG